MASTEPHPQASARRDWTRRAAFSSSLPRVEKTADAFHSILATDRRFSNRVFTATDTEEYRNEIEEFRFFGWLGGPDRRENPADDPRLGPKLLVMRRRGRREESPCS